MKSNKLSTLFIIVVSVISLFFLIRIIGSGDEEIKGSSDLQDGIISPFIYLAYVVFAIIIALTLFFVLRNLFTHKDSLKSALISGGLFLAVVFLSYVLSTGHEVLDKNGYLVLSESGDKLVGAGIISFYILSLVAISSMFFFGIKKMLKN
ncbi:MAG: hypothetical protein CVT96_04330 [Bacteroidetes bacterium HGW-Bacteroidetes-13]|nr:MAG: hypothetical protein CVT96_04330 [Bacteroidetes bacterium HGW-Bacteroidetes-13]